MADGLQRFGYLPNAESSENNPEGLPVGFVIDGDSDVRAEMGMTCAACHTGQLEYVERETRPTLCVIDGAPANADLQDSLLEVCGPLRAQRWMSLTASKNYCSRSVLGENFTPSEGRRRSKSDLSINGSRSSKSSWITSLPTVTP